MKSLTERFDMPIAWGEIAQAALVAGIAIAAALVLYTVIMMVLRRVTRLSPTDADAVALDRLRSPLKWFAIEIAISAAAQFDPWIARFWETIDAFVVPAVFGYLVLGAVRAFAAALDKRTEERVDPVAARSRKTRIALISRTVSVIVIIITVGIILLGFPVVRDVGTGLLASAGLAALAIGAAAQPALKSLIAGLQMAITEPLRLGDLVKVEGQAGRVEEIKMSYITVRTWDERVLVVPTATFLEDSFENWSRQSEALTGPVFLHLDPIADVPPIRAEFERFVATQELWDERTAALLVTEAYPESVELRLAVSANTIGDLFALRCAVREHMLEWLRHNQPDALIRHRLEVPGGHDKAGEPAVG